jgi:hypothetical protein
MSAGVPEIHSQATLNCSNCDLKMIIAKPFTKPNITIRTI